jgi:hypothetical protein
MAATDTGPNCNQPETMSHLYTCSSRAAWREQFITQLRKHLADTSTEAYATLSHKPIPAIRTSARISLARHRQHQTRTQPPTPRQNHRPPPGRTQQYRPSGHPHVSNWHGIDSTKHDRTTGHHQDEPNRLNSNESGHDCIERTQSPTATFFRNPPSPTAIKISPYNDKHCHTSTDSHQPHQNAHPRHPTTIPTSSTEPTRNNLIRHSTVLSGAQQRQLSLSKLQHHKVNE